LAENAAQNLVARARENTGEPAICLTGGSTPFGDYDRPVVLVNTLRIDAIHLVDGGRQVVCLPGSTLYALERKLKPLGREVWVTAPFADDSWPLKKLQASADALVLMAYDQHWGTGDPGSPAAQDWFEQVLATRMAELDPARTVLALGDYGYDWTLPEKGKPGRAEAMTFNEAAQTAHDSGAQAQMDEGSLNPTYGYQDDSGRRHAVWFLDAPTLFNQITGLDQESRIQSTPIVKRPFHPVRKSGVAGDRRQASPICSPRGTPW